MRPQPNAHAAANRQNQGGGMTAQSELQAVSITDEEFHQFQALIYRIAGISMSASKKALVGGRLARRLRRFALTSYGEYYRLLTGGAEPDEMQIAVDLLTTNETKFFREPKHFEFLRQQVTAGAKAGRTYRVWSAACSTGEEPYNIAMVLAECLGDGPWEVLASDLCTRVLDKARGGHYPIARAQGIPHRYLSEYCLRGVGPEEGTFLIDKSLRQRVQFMQINLNAPLPRIGEFDVVFLRNVMIYFNMVTKQQVVERILPLLKPGGHFIVGHSESLNGIVDSLKVVAPSVYVKP